MLSQPRDAHPENTLTDVARLSAVPAEGFGSLLRQSTPVVLTNEARDWPATRTWSLEFFRDRGHDVDVVLEHGNVMQHHARFEHTTLAHYIERLIAQRDRKLNDSPGYLSMFDIFGNFPELLGDVDFSLITDHRMRNTTLGWIGPGGTTTGYHFDWADNVFAQIEGRKSVKLISPSQSAKMYPSKRYDSNTKLSSVDADNFDRERYPKFATADALHTIVNPGELLLIPQGWWHHVTSLEPSISVNTFGVSWQCALRHKPRERLRRVLHNRGLYASECTCHMTVDGKRTVR